MNESQFRRLLDKYLKGKCSPEEIKLLHQFYASFQNEAPDAWDVRLLEEKVRRGIQQKIAQKERQQNDTQGLSAARFRSLLKMAASVLVIVSLGIGSYVAYVNRPAPEIVWMEKSTQKGQRATITLTDGTRVYLNANSQLSFPEHFSSDKREVRLKGEAFFEVVKNAQRSFIIKSGDITTTVLGTSFNVKAYQEEPLTVTVATGRVKVNTIQAGGSSEVFLRPNQQAYFDGQLYKREVDVNQYIAWRENIIRFEEATLVEAAIVLERWFGVSIEIGNEAIRQCKISGQYLDENLINIMKSFEYILGIRYRFEEGRKLIIEGERCKTKP